MSFIKKNCIFKISSLFGGYLWIFTVKRGGQPHGSDQCGYIHLLYRLVFCFTVVRVEPLCRLGCIILISTSTHPASWTILLSKSNPSFAFGLIRRIHEDLELFATRRPWSLDRRVCSCCSCLLRAKLSTVIILEICKPYRYDESHFKNKISNILWSRHTVTVCWQ